MDQTFIDSLQAQVTPVLPTDSMAEAGRKILLNDFIHMLAHEDGSRSGQNIEDVHDMRVATRRMRSALRLLTPYYRKKTVRAYRRSLRKVADLLGVVRDLDVMISNLTEFQKTLNADQQAALTAIVILVDQKRADARQKLIRTLDKRSYARFLKDFTAFLTTPGQNALALDHSPVAPFEVRHLLPEMIYNRLSAVRAYDKALLEADAPMLHGLRIEFKRLRYTVSFFTDVLGSQIQDFISELKRIQDHLGTMNDLNVARATLSKLSLDESQTAARQIYLAHLEAQEAELRAGFPEVWRHFNTKTVQRELALAVAAL